MNRMIDTHCHLDFAQFDNDRPSMIERAEKVGVSDIIHIGIDQSSWHWDLPADGGSVRIWRTAGLHPNSAATEWTDSLRNALRTFLETEEVVGVGETGIDLFRSADSLEIQIAAFQAHVELSQEFDLPIVIHQRAAEKEVLGLLKRVGPVRGVMHCFGGDWDYAKECLDLGLHLGIGGVATYPSASETRAALKRVPRNRLLLETDAPFLAPQPVRGDRNEPAYLTHVVDAIAEARTESAKEVRGYTTENAIRLFGLDR